MQVHFDFLPTAQHSNCGEEASRGYNSILLPNDLAIPSKENLGGKSGEKSGAGDSGLFSEDAGATQA